MEYIIQNKPIIKNANNIENLIQKLKLNIQLTNSEKELILDYYVNKGRSILGNYLNIDISEDPLTNRCDLAEHIIGKLLEKDGITVYPKETQEIINSTCVGHSFVISIIQDTPYLIDLTYRQFFLKENCNKENYFIKDDKIIKTPSPGYFMLDEEGLDISKKIIEQGYIELNNSVAKKYCDSFYYTKTGINDYSNITGSIYLKALLKENTNYAVDDERFTEMYGKVI